MNDEAVKYLCELSTKFHLETCEDWDTFFDLLENIKQTGCAYPSVMKTGRFKANNKFYEYADTDSITHKEQPLTVRTIRTFTEDLQQVGAVIPVNATNGDMIKALFPNEEIVESDGACVYVGVKMRFDKDWWNAPYESSIR